MAKFLVQRSFSVDMDEMQNVGRRSRELVEQQFPEIIWHHSHVVVDDAGSVKTYCIYEAPTEEIVRRHAEALGLHELEGVFEIAGDVTPADFPPV